MKKKHPKDRHAKRGFITGNIRHSRSKPSTKMGRAKMSASFTPNESKVKPLHIVAFDDAR
jgi:hypothetical protein